MFALRGPSFQNAGDIPPAALVEVNRLFKRALNPGGRILLLRLFQLLGNDRRNHADVLFIKGKYIRLLRAYPVRLGLDQVAQLELAALYLLYGFSSFIIIYEIEITNFAVALQFQAEDCAATHCLSQTLS